MARRGPKRGTDLPDFHLWAEVRRTVTPLRPLLEDERAPPPAPQALPLPPDRGTRPLVMLARPLPAAAPTRPPRRAPTPPGRLIEPNIKKRVSRGQIEIDARIDLHGMRQAEAREALRRFVRGRHAAGDRTVLVITGKGSSSRASDDVWPEFERGILRAMLPAWLSEPDLAPLVAGWDAAARGHGGEGAFYLRLRRGRA